MRNVIVVASLCAVAVLLGVTLRGAPEAGHTAARHGLTGWVPRKLTDEKKATREIEAVLSEVHQAYRDGNMDAVAARTDFPVDMFTDDWKGDVLSWTWDRDTWTKRMAPIFARPAHTLQRAHDYRVFLVSDSLATVDDTQTVDAGKSKVTIRSSYLVVRKDRLWLLKAVFEGGWGDSQLAHPELAAEPAAPGAASP